MQVVHVISGLNDGGAEAVLYRLCAHDTLVQHTVISLTDEGKYGALLRDRGIELHCLRMQRGRVSVTALCALRRLLRRIRPDVLQTWMYHADLIGGVLGRVSGIRQVFWGIRHTTFDPAKSKSSTIKVARLNAWLARWVPKGVICCAESAVRVHLGMGYPRDKMHVVANGYDLARLRPDSSVRRAWRSQFAIGDDTPLLGMVARFDPQKDHQTLFEALRRIKDQGRDFRCALVGHGMTHDSPALLEAIDRYGLKEEVLLLGPQADIVPVMNGLDLHVLSSSYGEAFPNVLAEAMACGTPCVATDVGDAARIVGEAGWIVPPGMPDALAAAVGAALDELNSTESWAARQGAARMRIANRFSIEKMISEYHEVWSIARGGDQPGSRKEGRV